MALSLMRHHGVYDYKFRWLRRRIPFARAGQCDERKKEIALAPFFVECNIPFIVKRTILHEIAHALAGAKHNHNKWWKKQAVALGCSGNRCYGKEVRRRPPV